MKKMKLGYIDALLRLHQPESHQAIPKALDYTMVHYTTPHSCTTILHQANTPANTLHYCALHYAETLRYYTKSGDGFFLA